MNKGTMNMLNEEQVVELQAVIKDGFIAEIPAKDTIAYVLTRELLKIHKDMMASQVRLDEAISAVESNTHYVASLEEKTQIILKALHDTKGE
jgi:hypothetical protein